MTEPERDDKAEQNASKEGDKQETDHVVEFKRHEFLRPPIAIGVFTVYLVLIGAIASVGVLAYYLGHKTTAESLLAISIFLSLFVPIGIAWYVRAVLPRKAKPAETSTRKDRLLSRWLQSPVNKFFTRIGNNAIFRVLMLSSYVFMVADSIRSFPQHPRFSLTIAIFYVANFFWLVLIFYLGGVETRLDRRIDLLWESNDRMRDIINKHVDFFDVLFDNAKFALLLEKLQRETNTSIIDALKSITNTMHAMATTTHPKQTDASSEPPKELPAESDEEPNNGA
jgi:hypothetical protein